MVVAAKFHVNTVLKLKIIFKDLIKLPTLAGKKNQKNCCQSQTCFTRIPCLLILY